MSASIELASKVFNIVYQGVDKISDGALKQIGVQIVQAVKEKTGIDIAAQNKKSALDSLKNVLYEYLESDREFKQNIESLIENFERQEVKNTQVNQNTRSGNNIYQQGNVNANAPGSVGYNFGTVNQNLRRD